MIPAMKHVVSTFAGVPAWRTVRPPLVALDPTVGARIVAELAAARLRDARLSAGRGASRARDRALFVPRRAQESLMKSLLALAALLAAHAVSHGAEIVVTMNVATAGGTGASAGTVRIVETPYGLAFLPTLTGLPPGLHGFHVHEKPSCAPGEQNGAMAPAIGAGGHLDPAGTKQPRHALGRRPSRRPAGALRRRRRQRLDAGARAAAQARRRGRPRR